MERCGFALFDTPLGRCGVAWNAAGVSGLQLPEASEAATRARIARRAGGAGESAPPRAVASAINAIRELLAGRRRDLSDVALDFGGLPEFQRRVYQAARAIPPGETRTYGELAAEVGSPGAARAVGQALGRNPFPIVVPCHRVLSAGGRPGGFSANGGVGTKLRMLAIEGARAAGTPELFEAPSGLAFDPRAAVAALRRADPVLARVVDEVGPFRIELQQSASLFGALAEAIVHQQLSTKAAATIHGRLVAGFGARGGPSAARVLAAPDEALRAVGLSRAKVLALRDLAERTERRALPTLTSLRGMNDEEVIDALTAVRGIGRWTAEMFLIFRLGRPDVLPVDDLGLRAGFRHVFGKRKPPTAEQVARHGARWQPYRSVASWYLWRAAERARARAGAG